MMSNEFEQAFGDFLECKAYDDAESALFDMVRIAFLAGWNAAGGEPPQPQKIFQLFKNDTEKNRSTPSEE